MGKFKKIKYLFSAPHIADMPKYLTLAGLLYSVLVPLSAGALDVNLGQYSKPALLAMAQNRPAVSFGSADDNERSSKFMILFGSAMASQMSPATPSQGIEAKLSVRSSMVGDSQAADQKETRKNVIVTAYSSTPDQTDSSPFITAMGSRVRDGIVAANFLKFGTKVRLPEIYGDKIFVVEDRMAKRNSHKVDIWMESRSQALQFGVKRLTLEILK